MPGWYERTQELRETGQLTMVGVIQEQHPDRCKLFMQWKQMDFPVLVDSLNLLEISVVPLYVLIDEYGIVRKINPLRMDAVMEFLEEEFEEPEELTVAERFPRSEEDATNWATDLAGEMDQVEFVRMMGDFTFRRFQMGIGFTSDSRTGTDPCSRTINLYELMVETDSADGPNHFKLGVVYRARYESEYARPHDFQKAIDHWLAARESDPNQYIWRRRLQQYGPQLDKPYPFYDWVEQARADITARGEEPVELRVEPRGSELATRSRDFTIAQKNMVNPDALGRISRDEGLVGYTAVIVPHTGAQRVRGASARVHLTFVPSAKKRGHWNNESRPMLVWIDAADGWDLSHRLLQYATGVAAVSEEPRTVEFEVRPTPGAHQRTDTLSGYALFNVCEGDDGVCVYRRLDFAISLDVLKQK